MGVGRVGGGGGANCKARVSSPQGRQAAQAIVFYPHPFPFLEKTGNGQYYEYSNDCSIGKIR